MHPYSGKWGTRVIAFLLFSEVSLSSCFLSSLTAVPKLKSTLSPSLSKIHHHTSLSVPERLRVGSTELSMLTQAPVDLRWGNAWLQRNLHEIKFSTWLTRVTRPGLPACSFIIPGLITDWTGCLVCLMPAQLLHGRNGLVTLRYNTLYYHLHFIYLAQISHARQANRPPKDTCNSPLLNPLHLLGNYSK